MEEIERAHIFVAGKVQGVGFRYSACGEARRIGLKGWVRNLPDGGVELIAEGARKDVEGLIEWCRKGPPAARVAGLNVAWEKAEGNFPGFSITH